MFNINKKDKVILYGISHFKPNIANNMIKNGYTVISYFDRRAEELNGTLPLPVYTIENAPYTQQQKQDVVVIICLQNAIQHDRVAKNLYEYGYNKILFLPVDINIKLQYAKDMRRDYQHFLREQYDKIGKIAFYSDLFYNKFDCTRCVINDYDSHYTVWLPLDLVFTSKEEEGYSSCNISSFTTYVKLINFFSSGKESSIDYFCFLNQYEHIHLNIYQGIDNEFLQHRLELYDLFLNELNRGMDFFIQSAPPAEWNKNGYFNLLDGQHRTVFLYTKGLIKFPVSILKSDFDKWINKEHLQICLDFIDDNRITFTKSPIPHPAFLYFPVQSKGVAYQFLSAVGEYLSSTKLDDKTILSIGEYSSFLGRFFLKSGAKQVIAVEFSQLDYIFEGLLNKLLYTNDLKLVDTSLNDMVSLGQFSIVIATGWFGKLFGGENQLVAVKTLDYMSKELLFWESGHEIESEKFFILNNTEFKHYHCFRQQFSENCVTEFGVFSKTI